MHLNLADHTYPMASFESWHKHLQGFPMQPFDKVALMLLIGANHLPLISPVKGSQRCTKAWHSWKREMEYLTQEKYLSDILLHKWITWKSRQAFTYFVIPLRGLMEQLPIYGPKIKGMVCVYFSLGCLKVAPQKQQFIRQLDLCAAVTGAPLARLLKTELTLDICHIFLRKGFK